LGAPQLRLAGSISRDEKLYVADEAGIERGGKEIGANLEAPKIAGPSPMNNYPLLTQTEVCKLLGISKKTLQNWRVQRKIGFVKFGHCTIRFRQEDVAEFINRRERKPVMAEGGKLFPAKALTQ
jgi:excisionase family DNA binding protein